ncbi:MAG: GNAT family N-acetyltransferase [Candidatus Omnitrophica bacterium]|nr:GNAT family N-acetyltransferase [Candidatus Omnitrophota bacterium]
MSSQMANTLTYDTAGERDAAALSELYHEYYPTLSWSPDYLRWQYFSNPAGNAQIWTARGGRKIVATFAAVPHRISVKGKPGIGHRMQDAFTRPEYRGFGIYHTMSRLTRDYLEKPVFPFNFAFPNEKSYTGFVKMGWKPLFRIPLWILSEVDALQAPPVIAKVSAVRRFDASTDAIWRAHVRNFDFAVERDAAYLNWRYFARPLAKYFAFRLTLGKEALVMVLKYYDREDGTRWAHVCDLFQSGVNAELAISAVGHAIKFAQENRCRFVSCWSPAKNTLSSVLCCYPFVLQLDLNRWFVVNMNASEGQDDLWMQESRWHLSMGDSDVY